MVYSSLNVLLGVNPTSSSTIFYWWSLELSMVYCKPKSIVKVILRVNIIKKNKIRSLHRHRTFFFDEMRFITHFSWFIYWLCNLISVSRSPRRWNTNFEVKYSFISSKFPPSLLNIHTNDRHSFLFTILQSFFLLLSCRCEDAFYYKRCCA